MQSAIAPSLSYPVRQPTLFDAYPPDSQLCISVVIPARNEADHLESTLDALRNQRQINGVPVPISEYEVLLLLNNCTDQSVAIGQRYQRLHPTFPLRIASVQLPPEKANVGTARRLLMDAAYRRLIQVNRPQGIIASTDGDTIVDRYWLAHIQAEIANGCEAVGGRILTRPDGNPVRVNHLRDVTYRMLKACVEAQLDPLTFDPWPRHFQHFGASLALTCAAYRRVGGLPHVPHLEDEALYQALLRTDTPIRKSPHVRVTTSTRLHGRVEVGFSEQLRYWDAMNQAHRCQLVEAAGAIIQRLQSRRQLRTYWQRTHIPNSAALQPIADELMLDVDWLRDQVDQSRYFGQLWEAVETQLTTGKWATYWKPVPITTAIHELRRFLRTVRSVQPA